MDADETERSRHQLELYLAKKGYFRNTVTDSIRYPTKSLSNKIRKKRAIIEYHIEPGEPYRINTIDWIIPDSRLRKYLFKGDSIPPNSLVIKGNNFDTDVLEAERKRVTNLYQDLGYFYFTKSHISIDADSSLNKNLVDLYIKVHDAQILKPDGTTTTGRHQVYYMDKITIDTDFRPALKGRVTSDTIAFRDYEFLYLGELKYKPKLLLRSVLFKKDDRYSLTSVENTYKRFSSLGAFRTVNLEFDTIGTTRQNGLNCMMHLTPAKERSFSIEGDLTNRGGYLGISGSTSLTHRNIFKGTETLRIRITGGVEAQQPLTTPDEEDTDLNEEVFFNTIEIGPEISLIIPKFLLPVSQDKFAKSTAPRTILSAQYSFQERPDFTRTLSKLSFGYSWKETDFKSWQVYPVELSIINIPRRSDSFNDYLEEVNDPFLTNSYTDHLILGPRIVYTFNNQQISKLKNVFYFRGTFESAGKCLTRDS